MLAAAHSAPHLSPAPARDVLELVAQIVPCVGGAGAKPASPPREIVTCLLAALGSE